MGKQELYEQYMHEVAKPLSKIRNSCRAGCQCYNQCGFRERMDEIIDKGTMIVTKISQED